MRVNSLAKICFLLFLLPAFRAQSLEIGSQASSRRIVVIAGNNLGDPGDIALRFAQDDATRVARALSELGLVQKEDMHLLLGRQAHELRRALEKAEQDAAADPGHSLILFFYSGHADQHGLHLSGTQLSWEELKVFFASSQSSLRIALVDACQAGMLTIPKGFGLKPAPDQAPAQPRGAAFLVSSESGELSQESYALGGSFFTHFLVSALRGAADYNGDSRVSLGEAHAYVSQNTKLATSRWAPQVQHPTFHFDLSGHGEVILSDLRRASALLQVDAGLSGHLVVSERGSSQIFVEAEKRSGQIMNLALPAGRYRLHLRKPQAVYMADLSLHWGGRQLVRLKDLSARSYQTVSQKGQRLELHRQRIRLGLSIQSGLVEGMGPLGMARFSYGVQVAPLEFILRLGYGGKTFTTVDTKVQSEIYASEILAAYDIPLGITDLRFWLLASAQVWRQFVSKQGVRKQTVFGAGLGLGLRVPLYARLFSEVSLELMSIFPEIQNQGRQAELSVLGEISLGWLF